MKRFVSLGDTVWWIEINGFCGSSPIYTIHTGYYLASYKLDGKTINIVIRNITSLVVKHLYDNEIFYDEEQAKKRLRELQNG